MKRTVLTFVVLLIVCASAFAQKKSRDASASLYGGSNFRSEGRVGFEKRFTPAFGAAVEMPVTDRVAMIGSVNHDLSPKIDTAASTTTGIVGALVRIAQQGTATFYVGTGVEVLSTNGEKYNKRETGINSFGQVRVVSKRATLRITAGGRWHSFASTDVPYASASKYVGVNFELGYMATRHVEVIGGLDIKAVRYHVPPNIVAANIGSGVKGGIFGGIRFHFDIPKGN